MKLLRLIAAVQLVSLAASIPALAESFPEQTAPLEARLDPGSQRETEANLLIRQHCTKCHSESRIMSAMQSTLSSKDENYEKEIKGIISRKIRLTNGDISRQDGKKIIEYLVAVRQNKKSGGKTAS